MLAAATVLLPAAACAGPFAGLQRLFKDWGLFQGLQVSGSNTVTLQQNLVQGSQSAYESQRWDTDSMVTQNSLSLEGPIWKEFAFRANISASGYSASQSSWVAGYVGHDTALYYGDLSIDLSGNQFASFSKSVEGYQLDQKIGRGLARAFYSKAKALTRTQTISGNNTSGPYFLSYTPIVEGSEIVKVNEDVQEYGVDYTLDYDSGQLYFETEGSAATIIPDTSTITVSYQSTSNTDSATLYGARMIMPLMGDRMQVGMTMVKQQSASGGSADDTVGYQEDIFNGSGSTGPFDVNYRPIIADGTSVVYRGVAQVINHPLVVVLDSTEQVEGSDYDSYRSIGRVIFRKSVPATSIVTIKYYYEIDAGDSATADNSILGLDLLYHVSPKLNLQLDYGKSNGGTEDSTGDALRLNLAYSADKLKVVGEYRDIAPTFSFLDSTGFYSQDKGIDIGVNWQPLEHVSVYGRRSDLKANEGYSFGSSTYYTSAALDTADDGEDDSSTGLNVSTVRNDLELRLDYPNWPSLAYQREQLSNTGGSSSNSSYLSNNYSLNWSPSEKPFTLSASLYQTTQNYLSTAEETEATLTGTNTRQMQWAASYRPSDKLTFSYNQGRNRSTSLADSSTSSSDTSQLSARWSPSSKLDFNYDRTKTSSVGSVSSSTYTSYLRCLAVGDPTYKAYLRGLGLSRESYRTYVSYLASRGLYTTGIADGGDTGDEDDDDEENRYTDNNSRLSVRYSPSQKLSLDFSLSKRTYTSGGSVGYLADSNQTTKSLSAMYQVNDSLSFNATVGTDATVYLEEDRGSVTNDTLTFGGNYRKPNSPWSLSLSLNKTSGASPTYTGSGSTQHMYMVDTDLQDMQARLSYSLSEDSEVSLTGQLANYSGGYSGYNKQQLELGYTRRLSSLTNLTFGYRFIRNLDKASDDPRYGNTSLTSGQDNYLTNTFLLTVSSQFNSGSGGGAWAGAGGSSLNNFQGYRAGGGLGSSSSSYGTRYSSGFQNLSVFGQGGVSSGFSSPFGTGARYSSDDYNGFGDSRPQGYETFGTGLGSGSNFTGGLGDISGGRRQGSGLGDMAPLPPGQGEAPDLEDWYSLDDMYSVWW